MFSYLYDPIIHKMNLLVAEAKENKVFVSALVRSFGFVYLPDD